jgi:hypothetical protein
MDIRTEIVKIINEESMAQKEARVANLKAKIASLKTAGRQSCDDKEDVLRGECYQKISNAVKRAEIALANIGRS